MTARLRVGGRKQTAKSGKTWWRRRSDGMRSVIVAGVISGAVTIVVAAFTVGPTWLADDTPQVELVDVVVRDVHMEDGKEVEPVPSRSQDEVVAIEITLFNSGESRAILHEAMFTVDETLVAQACWTQGEGIPVTGDYDLLLPPESGKGRKFRVPISQQVGADEADRFVVYAALDEKDPDPEWSFYRFGVSLTLHGTDQGTLDAGPLALALPHPPAPDGDDFLTYWGQEGFDDILPATDPQYDGVRDGVEECMRDNAEELAGFLRPSGTRSPLLREIGDAVGP